MIGRDVPFLHERDGVRLAGLDFGGDGPPAVLLHGLAGHAREWRATAGWLTRHCRTIALEARGHGGSERFPRDVSRAAHVIDAADAIERLALEPVVLVGQSFGGVTAIHLAAERPELVCALVLADAGPTAPDARAARQVADALRSWPVPFPTRAAALAYFGGPSPSAEAWADGLEQRDDGWWPRFDPDVMARTLEATVGEDCWEAWGRVRCPALVVRAGAGVVPPAEARSMAARRPGTRLVELPGAAHDLHLDVPDAWRDAVTAFLAALG